MMVQCTSFEEYRRRWEALRDRREQADRDRSFREYQMEQEARWERRRQHAANERRLITRLKNRAIKIKEGFWVALS